MLGGLPSPMAFVLYHSFADEPASRQALAPIEDAHFPNQVPYLSFVGVLLEGYQSVFAVSCSSMLLLLALISASGKAKWQVRQWDLMDHLSCALVIGLMETCDSTQTVVLLDTAAVWSAAELTTCTRALEESIQRDANAKLPSTIGAAEARNLLYFPARSK